MLLQVSVNRTWNKVIIPYFDIIVMYHESIRYGGIIMAAQEKVIHGSEHVQPSRAYLKLKMDGLILLSSGLIDIHYEFWL